MSNLTKSDKVRMRRIFEENGLSMDDVFQHRHFVIIKRTGIEKIQAVNNIEVEFSEIVMDRDFVVLKATAWMDNRNVRVETYGEAGPENCKNSYYVMTAEKRALSRAVLKVIGLYSESNVYSEDEGVHHE